MTTVIPNNVLNQLEMAFKEGDSPVEQGKTVILQNMGKPYVSNLLHRSVSLLLTRREEDLDSGRNTEYWRSYDEGARRRLYEDTK